MVSCLPLWLLQNAAGKHTLTLLHLFLHCNKIPHRDTSALQIGTDVSKLHIKFSPKTRNPGY
jgi:hypothetical protein